MFTLLTGLSCAIAPLTPPPRQDAQAAARPEAGQTLAGQLVELTVPTELIVRDATKAFSASFRTSFLRDPRAGIAEKRVPGLADAVVNAATVKMREILTAAMIPAKARISAQFAARLDRGELEAAVAFFSGPIGRRLLEATPQIAARGGAVGVLTPQEIAALGAFSQTSAGRKTDAMKLQQGAEMSAMVQQAMAAAQPEIDAIALAAAKEYVRAHGAASPGS